MDVANVVASTAVIPWFWIMAKFIICGDLYDLIPLTIFGYLLVLLKRAIHKENLKAMKEIQDDLQVTANVFTQTEPKEHIENSTQTLEIRKDACIQTAQKMFSERSTQTVQKLNDAYTQVEESQWKTTSTQTEKEIKHDKSIQTVMQTSEDKETQTIPYLCLGKEVHTENIQTSSKVFIPVKKQKPKPSIPLTKEFLKYHQNKHNHQRKKLKFKPKLEIITEGNEHDNETELSKLAFSVELEIEDSNVDKPIMEQNFCKASLKQTEESSNDGLHFVDEDVTKDKKKQKKASSFRKKFKNLKKLFKK
ncbi:hypothetical protein AVEN_98796-1 [Araneus ventricosus]|uniref:Uncharacterized protein n=1 Tax=Araneus ventricosus TaxID=182803 RepID=A0A4Y2I7A9_ARAVE|nr:hypothetical protein AVEN_98796-1 [Araneus ventricosus]